MTVRLSVVVVAFDMQRELPRTLFSLAPSQQRGINHSDYEIIVVDNGSVPPLQIEADDNLIAIRVDDASPSPSNAVNLGIAATQGDTIGVLVDGARLASPGLLAGALLGARIHDRPVLSTLGFHLGPDVQMRSIRNGYDLENEDRMLARSDWTADPYRLFGISTLAGSSSRGWFLPMAESNALFMPRHMWEELGGYSEAFVSPGGGLVNLDTYRRACALQNSQLVVLLGEGTFHQVHGGVATNAPVSRWDTFHAEYIRVRGVEFEPPDPDVLYLGRVNEHSLHWIEVSAQKGLAESASKLTSSPRSRP